jgi:hypothetical protein
MWATGFVGAVLFFASIEGLALRHPKRQWTLSKVIAYIGETWPLSIWISGAFSGGLAVHFYWPFCPIFFD